MTRPDAEIAELPTDPGARLRRQRESAGLGEQQVAERLNLDASVIAALESDDYAALGAPVFVRGHLRRYAALLGLPGDEILGAYDRSRAQLEQPSLVPKSRAEMRPARGRAMSPWLVGGALAFLAAAGIAAYLGAYGLHLPDAVSMRGTNAEVRSTSLTDTQTPPGDGRAASGPAAGAAQVAGVPLGDGVAVAVPPGQVGLVFDYAADSWTEVYDGSGGMVLYDLGKAGTRRAVAGVAPISITLGNAPGVSLTVNGRRVTLPAPPAGDTVARFGIGADGTLR